MLIAALAGVVVSTYDLLKVAHIVLAIVAVGYNASYGVLIGRAAREPKHLPHVLRTVKFMDDWIANPCYLALLATGAAMVTIAWDFRTFWIEAGMTLWVVAMLLGYGLYTPTLKKQIAALDAHGADSSEFKNLSARGAIVGALLGVIVLAIVFLMVAKPSSPFS